jgi:hypothetical protein
VRQAAILLASLSPRPRFYAICRVAVCGAYNYLCLRNTVRSVSATRDLGTILMMLGAGLMLAVSFVLTMLSCYELGRGLALRRAGADLSGASATEWALLAVGGLLGLVAVGLTMS